MGTSQLVANGFSEICLPIRYGPKSLHSGLREIATMEVSDGRMAMLWKLVQRGHGRLVSDGNL